MKRAAIALAAACGSSSHPKPDAPPPPRCDPTAAFGTPAPVPGLDTAGDELDARLTPDELAVVYAYASTPGGKLDIWAQTRANIGDSFGGLQAVGAVNSVYNDSSPTLSPDQLLLVFDSDRGPSGMTHVYASARAAATATFDPPTEAIALSDGEDHPMLANATVLYFASAVRAGVGMHDLWRAPIDDSGAVGTPMLVPGAAINTADDEDYPVVTPDELALFFVRTTPMGAGVYAATRASADADFGEPALVAGLAPTSSTAIPSWISPDRCDLYFTSNMPGGAGGQDVYVVTRGP
ncbi:MAG TPA: hypothetical protein VMJ10_04360 [Kofleriaceae bacterium]|nr:hypothetical protein [Kofleriaceae bacterium]